MKTKNETYKTFAALVTNNQKTYLKLSDLNKAILEETKTLSGVDITSVNFLDIFRGIAVSADLWPMKTVGKNKVVKPVPVNEAVKDKSEIALVAKRVHNWLYNTVEKPARDAERKFEKAAQLAEEKEAYNEATAGMTEGEIQAFELAVAANVNKSRKMDIVKAFLEEMGSVELAKQAIEEFLAQEK